MRSLNTNIKIQIGAEFAQIEDALMELLRLAPDETTTKILTILRDHEHALNERVDTVIAQRNVGIGS